MADYDNTLDYHLDLAPAALKRKWGQRWIGAFGVVEAAAAHLADAAVKAAIVTTAPVDALPFIGEERRIAKGPGEGDEAYRARLKQAWPAHEKSGTDAGVVEQLAVLGLTAHCRRDRQWKHDELAPGTIWSRMWIIIVDPPAEWPLVETWADLAAKYATYADWAAAKVGWGLEAPAATIAHITRVARQWTSSHALVVNIIVIARGRVFGFPVVETYADLPTDTYDSYVVRWDGW